MEDFLNRIYSIDNIIIYIIVAIVVLVILFFVILIFGKKDQKLEETKRLQMVNNNLQEQPLLKEENPEPTKLEAPIPDQSAYPDILITPGVPPVPEEGNITTPVEENIIVPEQPVENNVEAPISPVENNFEMPVASEVEEPKIGDNMEKTVTIPFEAINEAPILKKEEEKPLVISINDNVSAPAIDIPEPQNVEVTEFDDSNKSVIDIEFPVLPEENNSIDQPIELENSTFDTIIDVEKEKPHPTNQIFSSVFAPSQNEKKEEKPLQIFDVEEEQPKEESDLELPLLKKINNDEK